MIVLQVAKEYSGIRIRRPRLRRLIERICRQFHVANATVGVAIVGDEESRRLNRRFLHRRGSSDCLSFDLSDHDDPKSPKVYQIVVNGQRAAAEAKRRGHGAEAELALYVTHGLLHQLDFDDATAAQARRMHEAEDRILQESGYGAVYREDRNRQKRRQAVRRSRQ